MDAQSRRDFVKLAGGALASAPWTRLLAAPAPGRTRLFFTPEEFRLVDELSEMIIPADAHSPGARAAEVADFIDQRLAESFEAEPKRLWRDGLKRLQALCMEMNGRAFLEATVAQRTALLERVAEREADPQDLSETFFRDLKARTVRAYYTTKIGIHQEMEYKGNSYLEQFAGYEVTTGAKSTQRGG